MQAHRQMTQWKSRMFAKVFRGAHVNQAELEGCDSTGEAQGMLSGEALEPGRFCLVLLRCVFQF